MPVTKKHRRSSPVTVTLADGSTETVPASRFRRKAVYEFSLTQEQRSALFNGESPRITIPSGKCPFAPGDIYDVPGTKNLSLGIIGLAVFEGSYVLIYTVHDLRPRLLRASVHGVDFDSIRRSYDSTGVPSPLEDADAVAQAAEESAYTTSPGAALKGEPEAIHKDAEEEVIRRRREKTERKVRSPIAAINESLSDLEGDPIFTGQSGALRHLRKCLGRLEHDVLKEQGIG